MEADPSKFEGCLLGLAIGDSLGMPYEGWRPTMILSRLGSKVSGFAPCPDRGLRAGQWTDDTKMALQLAHSLIRTNARFDPAAAAAAYLEWFDSGDLRGIGRTTLDAILRLKSGIPHTSSGITGEYAAGNGAAMRVAPLALADCNDFKKLLDDAAIDAAITHNNPEAIAGSRVVSYLIALGVSGDRSMAADPALFDKCRDIAGPSETAAKLLRAKQLYLDKMPCGTALSTIGTSGYVAESVASSVYCFMKTPTDFQETVVSAVMGGGDTDTIAAIAGAISGSWNGTWNIPKHWVDHVEASDELRDIAGQLYKLVFGM